MRSSVSSAQNEHFVPIEHRASVRHPSLSPPLQYLASLPDTGDRIVFFTVAGLQSVAMKNSLMNTHCILVDRLCARYRYAHFER